MKKKKSSEPEISVSEFTDLLRQLLFAAPSEPVKDPLHQLPPPPELSGRAAELDELTKALESGVASGVVVQGPDGVGKTALALGLAAQLAPLYSDAQFFLDLRAEQPLAPAAAMAQVIHAHHPTMRLPESVAELGALYRQVLRGRRTLLVLDDAANVAQVEPLMPPAGCVLLVTARQFDGALPGLIVKQLEPLSVAASQELLLRLAPRLSKQTTRLAELCGAWPLALRLAGGALAKRTKVTPAAYVERLAEQRRSLEPVAAALGLNYELLTAQQQRHWRALAVFPASFDPEAAHAVWRAKSASAWPIAPATVTDELAELTQLGLLECDQASERYCLHAAARPLARARLSAKEAETAARRHAQHYLEVLQSVRMLDRTGNEGTVTGLSICDLERSNIAAGQAWAAAHAAEDKEVAQWVADYFYLGISLLIFRLRPAEVDEWLRAARSATRAKGPTDCELLGQLGSAYQSLGKARLGIEYLQQALAAARASGDRAGERRALGGLGDAYQAVGDMHKAIEIYQQYLDFARAGGDRRLEGYLLNNLGAAYGNLGQTEEAIECFQQHLAVTREAGDRFHEGHVLGNIGSAYANAGDARAAVEYFNQALEIIRELGDRNGEGTLLGHLGGAYFLLGDARAAVKAYEQALAISRKMGDRHNSAAVLWNLSLALDKLGNRARAIECAEASLRIREELEDPRAAQIRRQLAKWRGK